MKNFKVNDPKGVHFGEKHYPNGETITSPAPVGTHIRTFLHFGQVEEVKASAKQTAPDETEEEKAEREAAEAAKAAEKKAKK